MQPGKLRSVRRLAGPEGTLQMLAIDQRPPVEKLIAAQRHLDRAPGLEVMQLKRVLAEELAPLATAILVDPITSIGEMSTIRPDQGLLLTLEDAAFDSDDGGRRSAWIDDWSVDQIKRAGADGVKLLAWYRPDASPGVIDHQQQLVEATGEACLRFDIPFVLELLLYPLGDEARVPTGNRRAELVHESIQTFAETRFAVDVFKVENPFRPADLPLFAENSAAHRSVFRTLSRTIDRPWVLLSSGAPREDFLNALHYAYDAGASGYLAGRSIWWEAATHYPDWNEMRRSLSDDAGPFMLRLNELTRAAALPVFEHLGVLTESLLDPLEGDFRHRYPPMVSTAGESSAVPTRSSGGVR